MNLAVIGLGKLGLPLAALLASNGHTVASYDASPTVRNAVRQRTFQSNEPGLKSLLDNPLGELIVCDTLAEVVVDAELVFIVVPTPSLESGVFTNEHVIKVVSKIGSSLERNQKIVIDIVSTVMPGSCDGPIKSALEFHSGRQIGEDLGLCYNPEFIALGSVIHDMEFPDMHLIGQSSDWAGNLVEQALKTIIKIDVPVRRMKLIEAELVKISVNNFVTMKISFANMLWHGASKLGGIDIDVVTDAIGLDSRIGRKYTKAAAPYGGPCFPRDTRALSAMYRDFGLENSLSQATERVNDFHLKFLSEMIANRVEQGARIGVVGISYKIGSDVTEDSPGLALANELSSLGFRISVWDDENIRSKGDPKFNRLKTIADLDDFLSDNDFVVITRLLNCANEFRLKLIEKGLPYLDLWRIL
jgi:UDPglucose 6-dehydrogenase